MKSIKLMSYWCWDEPNVVITEELCKVGLNTKFKSQQSLSQSKEENSVFPLFIIFKIKDKKNINKIGLSQKLIQLVILSQKHTSNKLAMYQM